MAKISGLRVEEEKTGISLPTILPQHFPGPQAQRGIENSPPVSEKQHPMVESVPRAEHHWTETVSVPGTDCSLQSIPWPRWLLVIWPWACQILLDSVSSCAI